MTAIENATALNQKIICSFPSFVQILALNEILLGCRAPSQEIVENGVRETCAG
jgi:hypothetical protein